MLEIKKVDKRKYGYCYLGLEPGDCVLAFDGYKVQDVLDYTYYDSLSEFDMTVLSKDKKEITVHVEKDEDKSLGLTFKNDGLDLKTCYNDCLFCFVKQMPKGLRQSLYVKDDDYRQSFLYGNFVTLTNVSDEDLQRIIRLKLSPLYVSVQAMDPTVRAKMLNNRFAGKIYEQLTLLCNAGIKINAQIVLVKGVNDGAELDNTLEKLFSLPNVLSVAIVPCGITKYRDGLYPIEDIDREYARQILAQVQKFNDKYNKTLAFCADEFYFKANIPLPPKEVYGEFLQVENGIGLCRSFEIKVQDKLSEKRRLLKPGKYLTVCGTSVYEFMKDIVKSVEQSMKDVSIKLIKVENNFFGTTVNCTGLLTGRDILSAVKNSGLDFDVLLIPSPCVGFDGQTFLDGTTLTQLQEELGKTVESASIS